MDYLCIQCHGGMHGTLQKKNVIAKTLPKDFGILIRYYFRE